MIHKFNQFVSEELTGKYKEETEIIYKSKDMICLMPKSQMASSVFGNKTGWCTISKFGFDDAVNKGKLLFRFLFKDGYKLRLTMDVKGNQCDWSDKTGYHLLKRKIEDSFELNQDEISNKNLMEISKKITSIPEECQKNVMDFYEKWKDGYNGYVKKDDKYMPLNLKKLKDQFNSIWDKWISKINDFNDKNESKIIIDVDYRGREFHITMGDNLESFKSVKEFENRLGELLK